MKYDICKNILDLWAEHCDGEWHDVISLKDGSLKDGKWGVALSTWEDTTRYPSIEAAAKDCLYTIGEWLKEDLDPKTVIETYLGNTGATMYLGAEGWCLVEDGEDKTFDNWNEMIKYMDDKNREV